MSVRGGEEEGGAEESNLARRGTWSGGLMAWRVPEFSAKAERFPKRRRPPHENLPGELLHLKKRLAEAHSPDRAIGSQLVGHIQQRVSVFHAAIQLKIPLGFQSAPYLFFAPRHVGIIMILMKHRRDQRGIDHGQILLSHRLDQPMIKPQPPDREIGNPLI